MANGLGSEPAAARMDLTRRRELAADLGADEGPARADLGCFAYVSSRLMIATLSISGVNLATWGTVAGLYAALGIELLVLLYRDRRRSRK